MNIQQYQTIKYRYFNYHKKDLIVILPGAGLDRNSHQPLINRLSKVANVFMIDDGYFGLARIENLDLKLYSSSNFRHNFKLLLRQYNYSKLYILGSSVGCIHAIRFILDNPDIDCKTLLASLPIFGPGKARIALAFLNLALMISPIYSLSLFINIIHLFPGLCRLSHIMKKTVKKIDCKSYLLCFKDIAEFSSKSKNLMNKISKRNILILFGEMDPTFDFCDDMIKKMTGKLGTIPGRHSLFTENPDEIIRIVRTELIT